MDCNTQTKSIIGCCHCIISNIILLLFLDVLLDEFVDTKVLLRKRITLDCIYTSNETLIQSSWLKWNGSSWELIVSTHKTYGTYISENYKGKMTYVENSSSDFSLTLENASVEDTGTYLCKFTVFPIGTVQKRIRVQTGKTCIYVVMIHNKITVIKCIFPIWKST